MLPKNSIFDTPIEKWPADWVKLQKELQPLEKHDSNLWRTLVNTHLNTELLKINTEAAYKMLYQHFWVNVLPKIKKDPAGFILAAVEGYDVYIQKWLARLSKKDEKEIKALLNMKSPVGDTALHRACDNGHVTTVKVLLEHGAKPNVAGLYGETPLHRAAYHNSVEIIDLLLKHGASCEAQRSDDEKPIHVAAYIGSVAAVERFIKHDVTQLNTIGRQGNTPLYSAAIAGRILVMHSLLRLGADPNKINENSGNNILHVAAIQNNPEIIAVVADYNPNFNLLNIDGLSPLGLCAAQRNGSPEATQALILAMSRANLKAT